MPLPPPADLGAVGGDGIPNVELAGLLGIKRASLNTRITRLGGVQPGQIAVAGSACDCADRPRAVLPMLTGVW